MALYHTHRPQTFESVIGQDHVVKTIKNQILSDKIAHAYLFAGPRGVGKTTTARILAKAVNCPRKKGSAEPDNDSECAREINESRCIDVIEIDAASHTGVDNVRENIIENAQFKPTKCAKKVFIIDEVHMLSSAAFNALLKTLEEPPEHVLFILATTELHKLPVTIVSRCQRFTFKRVPYPIIESHLKDIAQKEGVELDSEVLSKIARKSEGCVRDAVSLLDQILSSGKKKLGLADVAFIMPSTSIETQLSFIEALVKKNAHDAFAILENVRENGTHIEHFADELIDVLRHIMIYKVNPDFVENERDMNKNEREHFGSIASNLDEIESVNLIDLALKRKTQIRLSPTPELPLQMLALEWSNTDAHGSTEVNTGNLTEAKKKSIEIEHSPTGFSQNASTEPPSKAPVSHLTSQRVKENELSSVSNDVTPQMHEDLSSDVVIDEKTFTSKWPKILEVVEKNHPSLSFVLKMVEIVGIKSRTLTVSTQYAFHKEKLCENTCKANIEKIIEETLGAPLILEVILDAVAERKKDSNELQELANAFGGEVIS